MQNASILVGPRRLASGLAILTCPTRFSAFAAGQGNQVVVDQGSVGLTFNLAAATIGIPPPPPRRQTYLPRVTQK
jgi:hypothetical protein